ncbi:MFS transporter [Virgibacillus ndiopensis]|uniref:MFS transporter n=1 Tax=Virgibacillus ndiopensis TaxID=2004408 RepID=UPI000C07F79F|nr:MFS transporter [Virgibacillus ndiopensis]
MTAKKRVVGIALLTGLAIMGDSMLLIVLPIYWRDFGLTAIWQIGALLSINRFIRLPINPFIGLFYQKYQLRTGLLIAIFLAIISTFSYGVLHNFWFLFFARALWGIAWSLLRLGGYLTVIEVATQTTRGKFVGLYNGIWGLGGLVGMLGGGLVVEQTSVIFVTTIFALVGICAIPIIFLFVPISKQKVENDQTGVQSKKGFSSYVWLVLITGLTMGFIIFGLFASTLSQLIERSYTTEWTVGGIIIGAATIAGFIQAIRWGWDPFVASAIGKRLDVARTQINFLFIPLLVGGILLIILGIYQPIEMLIGFLLIFQLLSTMFVTTTDTLATNAAATTNSIKIITAHTVVVDVGAALGPFIAFIVIQFFSLTTVYLVASSILFCLAFSWFVFQQKLV